MFAPNPGTDAITGFSDAHGGVGALYGFGVALNSVAAVLAHAMQVGADTVIAIDGVDSITLAGVLRSSLVAHDFIFG